MQPQDRRTALRSLLTALTLAGLHSTAIAGAGCCSHCRCQTRCRKVCRLVQEEKKITTSCWGMECEDFCVPGPSTPDCKHSEMLQPKTQDDKKICAQPRRLTWTSWIPGCSGNVLTKRKLMKKTITTKVPSFKWVVEDLCPQCTAKCETVTVPEATEIPPAPKVEGALVLAAQKVSDDELAAK